MNIAHIGFAIIFSLLLAFPFSNQSSAQSGDGDGIMITPDVLKRKEKEAEEAKKPKPEEAAPVVENNDKSPDSTDKTTNQPPAATVVVPQPPATQSETNAQKPASTDSATQPKTIQTESEAVKKGAAETSANPDIQKPLEREEESKKGITTDQPVIKQEVVIKATKDILAPANWRGTIMFDPNNLKIMKAAREIYLKNKASGISNVNNANGDPKLALSEEDIVAASKQKKEVRTPVIILDSIAFFDKDHWSIWINGQKYNKGDNPEDLKITAVTRDSVTFTWNAPFIDIAFPEWKNISTPEGDKRRMIKRGNNKIFVDETTGDITFSLFPNQSFIGRTLDIIEGKSSNTGFDVIPIAQGGTSSAIDKVLDALTPDKNKPQ